MAVSRPGLQFAGATLLSVHEGSAVEGGTVRPGALAETTPSVLRTPPARAGVTPPRIVSFPRQRARHVHVALESTGSAVSPVSVRTLSVIDTSAPTLDLALGKRVIASSAAAARSTADNPAAAVSAVDGNPGTRWSPAAHDDRPWIRLDLGDSAFFDHVCVLPGAPDPSDLALRLSVSEDGERWTEPETTEDLFAGLRIDLGATVPPCSVDCPALHVEADPATWQVFAINHTAVPIVGAGLSARIYDPFGSQLSHIEQRDMIIEPLSVAAGFVVSRPPRFPPANLVSLQLHDSGGALLSERNCWRYGTQESPRGTASSRALRL